MHLLMKTKNSIISINFLGFMSRNSADTEEPMGIW